MTFRRRIAALGLGCVPALLLVGLLELHFLQEEAKAGLELLPLPRKFGMDPRDELNSLGFREREPGPKKGFRVLAFGDSVTYGVGVGAEETWTRLAESEGVEILNFGVPGYDAEQIAGTLAEQAPALSPDLLVYALFSNDSYPTRILRLHEEDDPVAVDGRGVGWGWLQPHSAIARRWLGAKLARELQPADPSDLVLVQDALDSMVATARALGVPLLVFGLPVHVLADADPIACAERAALPAVYCVNEMANHSNLQQLTLDSGVPFASALPYLRASGQVDFFLPGGRDPWHPNAAGHRVLGAAFSDVVRRARAGEAQLLSPPALTPAGGSADRRRRRGRG
ncbi:MAG: GDSL-type esterase/lipase family protein [Pseudomonadota bacterium]|nr:GDSL-type esterase/lipase family protein [Pseudomonadota bacterium]